MKPMVQACKKIAIVLNNDTEEERHRLNVDRSLKCLTHDGYETFVSNNDGDLDTLLSRVAGRASDETELVIYVTGHGESGKEEFYQKLDGVKFKERTVIVDRCFGGNYAKIFSDDPRTLFISLGSKDEPDVCDEFSPKFWGEKIPDLNKDGVTSWQERYANAVASGILFSSPQFIPTEGYREAGVAPFEKQAKEVLDNISLQKELSRLKPGEYAVIAFSATWCGGCKIYLPQYKRFAKEDEGQHLWLWTENDQLRDLFGVEGIPSVVLMDSNGNRFVVDWSERESLDGIYRTKNNAFLPPKTRIQLRLAATDHQIAEGKGDEFSIAASYVRMWQQAGELGNVDLREELYLRIGALKNASARIWGYSMIATVIQKSNRTDLKALLPGVFQKALESVEQAPTDYDAKDNFNITNHYVDLAKEVAEAGRTYQDDALGEMAADLFDVAIEESLKYKARNIRLTFLRDIAYRVTTANSDPPVFAQERFSDLIAHLRNAVEQSTDQYTRDSTMCFIASSLSCAKYRGAFLDMANDLIEEVKAHRIEARYFFCSLIEDAEFNPDTISVFKKLVMIGGRESIPYYLLDLIFFISTQPDDSKRLKESTAENAVLFLAAAGFGKEASDQLDQLIAVMRKEGWQDWRIAGFQLSVAQYLVSVSTNGDCAGMVGKIASNLIAMGKEKEVGELFNDVVDHHNAVFWLDILDKMAVGTNEFERDVVYWKIVGIEENHKDNKAMVKRALEIGVAREEKMADLESRAYLLEGYAMHAASAKSAPMDEIIALYKKEVGIVALISDRAKRSRHLDNIKSDAKAYGFEERLSEIFDSEN